MLESLKPFITVLIKIVPFAYKYYKGRKRTEVLLELHEAFFIIKGLIETADDLLEIVGPKPTLKISDLSREQMRNQYDLCQAHLTVQTYRMQRLSEIFLSKPFLDFYNPELRSELEKAIGTKEEALFNIGAGLFFHQLFGAGRFENESDFEAEKRITKKQAEFIENLYNIRTNESIDIESQRLLIEDLKKLQKKLGDIINDICNEDEKIELSTKAVDLAKKYSCRPE